MPTEAYALCPRRPMPTEAYAVRVPHLSEKGYIPQFDSDFLTADISR